MMIKKAIRRIVTGSIAFLLVTFSPGPALLVRAQEAPADTTAVCPTYAGATAPTGAAAITYAFNPTTCLWENDYYTWNPENKQYTKKTAYDWVYVPANGTWAKVEPALEPTAPDPVVEDSSPAASSSLTAEDTGPDSSNTVDQGADFNVDLDSTTDAAINDTLTGIALSGNAYVGSNTWGGSATSGDADSVANIINMLQSSSGFGGDVSTFSADINGDVYGDLFLNPALLADLQGAGNVSDTTNLDIDINEHVDGSIVNDINLDAGSGDATVESNTNAGDATSGNANAVLNLVNMINSAISSGQSFLGMLNIYGNLNGDILLPPEVLNQVIANNAPTSTVNSSVIENTDILADFTNNQTITNDIDMAATTGTALVDGNTTAGNALTGDANTNLTVLNLTGREVIAANSLLVFVNVLGQWVGLIMDAPTGTTAAALGTGVTQNTLRATNVDVDIDNTTNSEITNDIDLSAASGDALVRYNTNAGDARSGNATASANVVNILNTSFALSDWFGILFINVFGTWNGSFGIDTLAGGMAGGTGTADVGGSGAVAVFTFVPGNSDGDRLRLSPSSLSSFTGSGSAEGSNDNATLAATSNHINGPGGVTTTKVDMSLPSSADSGRNPALIIGSLGFGAALIGIERFLTLRRRFY